MENFDKVAYSQKVQSLIRGGQLDKAAAAITPYIRLRLYEDSFCNQTLANRTVTENELQPEIDNDSYFVISHVEQGRKNAVVANFIDRPVEDYIYAERFKIPVGLHKTRQATKSVHELRAYTYDIMADAAEKDINELGNLRDWKLIQMLNRMIARSGKQTTDLVDPASEGPVQIDKIHFNRLGATLNTGGRSGLPDEDRLQVSRYLTHRQLVEDLALLDDSTLGTDLTGEVFQKGTQIFKTVLGVDILTSIKERMFVESDHTTILTITAASTGSANTVTIDGVTLDIGTASSPTSAATKLAVAVKASTALLDLGVSAVASGTVVRISRRAASSDEQRTYIAGEVAVVAGSNMTFDQKKGFDRFDILWALPDERFIGEIIRIAGNDLSTEMWKTDGEEMVNRVSREYFGMGVGNANAAAKLRIQRGRYLG